MRAQYEALYTSLWGANLNSQTPSDGCRLATMPFMWRVVSVQPLYTATVPGPRRDRSCCTVLVVCTARGHGWCAWMSCRARGI